VKRFGFASFILLAFLAGLRGLAAQAEQQPPATFKSEVGVIEINAVVTDAAGNIYVKKAEAPLTPVVGIAAGTAVFGPSGATTPGFIPTAFTTVATPGTASAVVTFSGQATCVAPKPTIDLACPIQILVDGQALGKVNFAPVTAASPAPAPLTYTVTQTTVLQKGGHVIAVQYAGAKNVIFTLKSWNLAVQAYPELPEPLPTETTKTTK